VLGVELSARAVEAFYHDHGLQPLCRETGPFSVYEAAGVTLYCGDFLALQPAHTVAVTAVYDRAALIALPGTMRPGYARQLTRLTVPGTPLLLIVLDQEPRFRERGLSRLAEHVYLLRRR
jgi:thiopurine S-methyltransferase